MFLSAGDFDVTIYAYETAVFASTMSEYRESIVVSQYGYDKWPQTG